MINAESWLAPGRSARGSLLLLLLALLAALLPRVPMREPYDPVWRDRVAAAEPEIVILGNCLVSWFEPDVLGQRLDTRAAFPLSVGGSYADEWYALLSHAVLQGEAPPSLVILPFVGEEFSESEAATDLWARRRVARWIPAEAPADPRWEAVEAGREGALSRWIGQLSLLLFRPTLWRMEGMMVPRRFGSALASPGTLFSSGRSSGPGAESLVEERLAAAHFRRDLRLMMPQAADEDLPGAERVSRSALPALAALVHERGSRLLLIRFPSESGDSRNADAAFAEAALQWSAEQGIFSLDATADPVLSPLLQSDPLSGRRAFSERVAERLRGRPR